MIPRSALVRAANKWGRAHVYSTEGQGHGIIICTPKDQLEDEIRRFLSGEDDATDPG